MWPFCIFAAEEKEKLSDEIIEAMVEREEEKLTKGKKKNGKKGKGNGAVVNGNGNKENAGDEKMDAEKTEAEVKGQESAKWCHMLGWWFV